MLAYSLHFLPILALASDRPSTMAVDKDDLGEMGSLAFVGCRHCF